MKRVYVYLSDVEYETLEKKAEEIGMTPSAYFKYLALLPLHPPGSNFVLPSAMKQLQSFLVKIPVDQPFIISTPFPSEWPGFTRSEKNTLSKQLRIVVDRDPSLHVLKQNGKEATVYVKR